VTFIACLKSLWHSGQNCFNCLSALGSISPTCLCTAFMQTDSQRPKKSDKFSVFFALLGSARAKAVCRMLMKLAPGLGINLLFELILLFFRDQIEIVSVDN
jgi:hypothetical protein